MQVKGRIKFAKGQNEFYTTLKKRVDQYFKDNNISKHANRHMVIKTICMLTAYILPLVFMLTIPMSLGMAMIMYVIMGMAVAGIGMSVMHDANHGAYTHNKTLNNWIGYTLNLVGGISHNWKLQHNILHHTYTNIVDMDEDIDPKGGMRFSPHHHYFKRHKYQFLYAFVLYGLSSFYWILAKDFIQFVSYTRNGVNPNSPAKNRMLLAKMILIKGTYLFAIIGLPILIAGFPVWGVLAGFLAMHFTTGLILAVTFQMAHTVEGTEHPVPDAEGNVANNWAIHQMKTTVNFARGNKVLSWYIGGLNYQVEHHLFPKICHVHYPAIAPLVEQTAKEYGVPYMTTPRLGDAFMSHLNMLKKLGTPPMEEIMG